MAQDGNASAGEPLESHASTQWLIEQKKRAADYRQRRERPAGKRFGRWLGDFLDQDTPGGLFPAEEKLLAAALNGDPCVLQSRASRLWSAFNSWQRANPKADCPPEAGFADALTKFLAGVPEAVQEVIHEATITAIVELGFPADWEPNNAEETHKLASAQKTYFARLSAEADPAKTLGKARNCDGFFLLAAETVAEALTPAPGKPVKLRNKWFTSLLRNETLKVSLETRTRIDAQPRILRQFFGELVRSVRASHTTNDAFIAKLSGDPRSLRPLFTETFDRYERETWRRVDPDDSEIRLRADFVRFLVLGGDEAAPLAEKALEVTGAFIEEDLDLSGCTLPQPLLFSGNYFGGKITLKDATAQSLNFRSCRIQSIDSDNAKIYGGVFLNGAALATGEVSFRHAFIEGELNCAGSRFLSTGGTAISCESARIRGGACLNSGFTSKGGVSFQAARIGGNLHCEGGAFLNRTQDGQGIALDCRAARIAGQAFLMDGFRAEGLTSFSEAKIAGAFGCNGGTFTNDTPDGAGAALDCCSAKIGSTVQLGDGFSAHGQVLFRRATVDGDFACTGGEFENLAPAGGEGALSKPAAAVALDLRKAVIGGTLLFSRHEDGGGRTSAHIAGSLNLTRCQADELEDHKSAWPRKRFKIEGGKTLTAFICLDGFIYNRFAGPGVYEAAMRKRWLKRQPPTGSFELQPFDQLISVYRTMGRERDALVIAKFKRRRQYRARFAALWKGWRDRPRFMRRVAGDNLFGSAIDSLDWLPVIVERLIYRSFASILLALEWSIMAICTAYGHGYVRIAMFLSTLWLAGGLFYGFAAGQGAFAPANPVIYLNKELEAKCAKHWTSCPASPPEFPSFDAFTYSADIMLPGGDLGQKRDWRPVERPGNPVRVQVPVLYWLPNSDPNHDIIPELTGKEVALDEGTLGAVVRTQTLLSWAALGLLFAMLSGLIKRD